MQIFHPSRPVIILLCFVLWFLYHYGAAAICMRLPDRFFQPEAPFYRPKRWEDGGKTYQRVFRVHAWKKFLPDGGAMVQGGYRKRNLTSFSRNSLERFLVESCRGEATHWLALFPFWTFGLFAPARIILYMLVYALAMNLPCIIAQRYNRPRILRLLERGRGYPGDVEKEP